jgi:hypothetical protein
MPKNVGGEGYRPPRGSQRVSVAHNDNGRIHLEFRADLQDPEDHCFVNEMGNEPDSVNMQVERKPVKILGWKLK